MRLTSSHPPPFTVSESVLCVSGLGSGEESFQRRLAGVAAAAEPGAAERFLIAVPALLLGSGPGLQPYGQVMAFPASPPGARLSPRAQRRGKRKAFTGSVNSHLEANKKCLGI